SLIGTTPPRAVELIVPTSASVDARRLLEEWLTERGFPKPRLRSSAEALLDVVEPAPADFERLLVVEVSHLEARVSIVEGSRTVLASRSSWLDGQAGLDAAIVEAASLALLREH